MVSECKVLITTVVLLMISATCMAGKCKEDLTANLGTAWDAKHVCVTEETDTIENCHTTYSEAVDVATEIYHDCIEEHGHGRRRRAL